MVEKSLTFLRWSKTIILRESDTTQLDTIKMIRIKICRKTLVLNIIIIFIIERESSVGFERRKKYKKAKSINFA